MLTWELWLRSGVVDDDVGGVSMGDKDLLRQILVQVSLISGNSHY